MQSVGMVRSSGALRTTGKNMTHKLKAFKEKTTASRSCSTVLLPANWSTLRVAKLLHVFANRCASYARLALGEHRTESSANQSGRSFSIGRYESNDTREITEDGGLLQGGWISSGDDPGRTSFLTNSVRRRHLGFVSRDSFSFLESVRWLAYVAQQAK